MDGYEKVYRAGLVPYIVNDDGVIEMMFMIPSDPTYGGSSPQISKGKIEPGENAKEAAIREASEELGLFPANIDGNVYHVGNFLGRTEVYMCKIKDKDMFGVPCYETKNTVWMTFDDFMRNGRQLHTVIVKDVMHLISKVEHR